MSAVEVYRFPQPESGLHTRCEQAVWVDREGGALRLAFSEGTLRYPGEPLWDSLPGFVQRGLLDDVGILAAVFAELTREELAEGLACVPCAVTRERLMLELGRRG